MAYTEQEVAAFAAKDRRISKLACIKAAVEYSSDVSPEQVLEVAKKFLGWVYDKEANSTHTIPMPIPEQNKALKTVQERTSWDAAQVWKKFKKYPTMDNVEQCITKIQGE